MSPEQVQETLDLLLDELTLNSETLFKMSVTQFETKGRGAFIFHFDSLEKLLDCGMDGNPTSVIYLTRDEISKAGYSSALDFIDSYDTSKTCVLISSVDAVHTFFKCRVISSFAHFLREEDEDEMHSKFASIKTKSLKAHSIRSEKRKKLRFSECLILPFKLKIKR